MVLCEASGAGSTIDLEPMTPGCTVTLKGYGSMRSSVPFLVPLGEDSKSALDRSLTDLAEDIVQAFERWK